MSKNGSRDAPRWEAVVAVLTKHYKNPDTEAARVLCATLASHSLKQFPPAWCLAIAPPGSMKTDFLESFRGLPGVHFVDEVTTNTFLSGKVDEKRKKRTRPTSWLHRIGRDGVLIAADFSTFTSNPKTLGVILSQLRRIYDGNFSREFGTDENLEERSWSGRLTVFAGAVPDVDRHYSLFQSLGERFVRVRWPRVGGVETGLQAMKHTVNVSEELRGAVHALMLPFLSTPQTAPVIPEEIERKIANLSEFIALARTLPVKLRVSLAAAVPFDVLLLAASVKADTRFDFLGPEFYPLVDGFRFSWRATSITSVYHLMNIIQRYSRDKDGVVLLGHTCASIHLAPRRSSRYGRADANSQ